MVKKRITVYWLERAKNKVTRDNICAHFGVKSEMTINGETTFEIDTDNDKLLADLLRMEIERFLSIRFKEG